MNLSQIFWSFFIFCILFLFLVNGSQASYLNPACPKCISGINLYSSSKNLFTISFFMKMNIQNFVKSNFWNCVFLNADYIVAWFGMIKLKKSRLPITTNYTIWKYLNSTLFDFFKHVPCVLSIFFETYAIHFHL